MACGGARPERGVRMPRRSTPSFFCFRAQMRYRASRLQPSHGPKPMTHPLRVLASFLAIAFMALPASADEDRRVRFDIERYRPAVDGAAGFAVSDPRGLELGKFALSLNFHSAFSPLVVQQESGERVDLVSQRLGGTLSGLVGIGFKGMLSMGVDIPFVLYQSGSFSALPPSTQPTLDGQLGAVAMGDLRLSPRVALLQERKDGVDLAVDASFVIPTGDTTALVGDSGFGGSVALTLARTVQDFRFLGQVGARIRSSDEPYLTPIGSELLIRGAAIYNLDLGPAFYLPRQVVGEVDVATLFSSMFASGSTPAEWRVGARFCAVTNLAVTAGGGGGLSPTHGTPFARVNLGVAWDPRACSDTDTDTDGDGVPDSKDECPTVAGVWALNGCPAPEVDTDGDGIPDFEDECPTEPGLAEFKGCPAPGEPVDTDGDGIPDSEDKCPDVPGVVEWEGCPPPSDRDGDGVPDDIDECPDEPGLLDYAGCPRRDTDGDGLFDDEDKCPNEAGPKENQGCPYPDSDGDGIPDHEDNCPNEPGPASNYGCKQPQVVVIRKERIEILENVHFATGSAVIDKRSFNLLNQVAGVIREHPELTKIRVEGHTDNVGAPEKNMALSQSRAESVRDHLVGQGVDKSRVDAVGYGQERPISPNITSRGRDANRRVEFSIITDGRQGASTGGVMELELEPVVSEPVIAPAPTQTAPSEVEKAPPAVEETVVPAETPEEEVLMGFDEMPFDLPMLPDD